MDSIRCSLATYIAWSVCVFVCLFVGPRNHDGIRWGPDLPTRRGTFGGQFLKHGRPARTVTHRKTISSVMTSLKLSETTSTAVQPLYRRTCISQHPQLKIEKFVQANFTARMPLLTATSAFGLKTGRMLSSTR